MGFYWVATPNPQYFPSQNSAYHSYFGKFFWEAKPHLLPSSEIRGQFVDQHLIYHAYLSFFDLGSEEGPSTNSPWIQIKIANAILFGALAIVLASILQGQAPLFLALLPIMWVLSSPAVSFRLQLLRVDVLSLFFILLGIQLVAKAESTRGFILWRFALLLGLLTSWVNFVSYLSGIWICFKNRRLLLMRVFSLFAIGFLSLWLRTFDLSGIQYFFSSVEGLFFSENTIREWQPRRNFFEGYSALLLGLPLMTAFFFKKPDRSQVDRSLLAHAYLFALVTLLYARFEFAAGITIALGCVKFSWQYYGTAVVVRRRLFLSLGLILFSAVGFSAYKLMLGKEAKASKEVMDFRPLAEWLKSSPDAPSRIINVRWEYWSELLWLAPQVTTEPGFSLIIYGGRGDENLRCLSLLQRRNRPNLVRLGDCMQRLTKKFKSNHFVLDRSQAAHGWISLLPQFRAVYRGPDASVYEWLPDVQLQPRLESFQNMDSVQASLQKLEHFYLDGWLRSVRDDQSLIPLTDLEKIRSIYSAWALCRNKSLRIQLCYDLQKSAAKERLADLPLAFTAFWGLLSLHTKQDPEKIVELQARLAADLSPLGTFGELDYRKGSNRWFAHGQLLLFLINSLQLNSNQELIPKILKGVDYYHAYFILEKNPFMIRWLAEVLASAAALEKVKGVDQRRSQFASVEKIASDFINADCSLNEKPSREIWWSGLFLEGLSHGPREWTQTRVLQKLKHCALRALQPWSAKQGFYHFSTLPNGSVFRIDNHVHSLIGVLLAE